MQALDAATLLMVNAVFNGFAAVAWCLLASLFRIAPTASWLMAAAHLSRVIALRIVPGLPGWAEDYTYAVMGMVTAALVALALRRMLRLERRWGDIAVLAGLGLGAQCLLVLLGRLSYMPLVGSLAVGLLTLVVVRDILVGARPSLGRVTALLMALPYLTVVALSFLRVVQILAAPQSQVLVDAQQRPSAAVAALWLLVTTAMTISLIALLIWRLISRIEHLTLRDPMTRALNRRAIAAEMQTLQANLERGHGFSVVIADIDHFKRINDEHGHAAGDAALLHFVTVMREGLRDLDRLGRLGGEEFCLLLPHTSAAGAAQVAERLRAELALRPLEWRGKRIPLSASFGVVAGQPGDAQGEAAMALADREVYRAKAEGRNRVCVADDEGALATT